MSAIDQSLIGNKLLRFEICLEILFHNTIPDKKQLYLTHNGLVSLHYTVDRRISEFFLFFFLTVLYILYKLYYIYYIY